MRESSVGFAAVGLLLLGVLLFGSLNMPSRSSSSSSQHQAGSTRRTLIGRQDPLDSESFQLDSEGDSNDDSYYMPWIEKDLAQWQDAGIKQVMGERLLSCQDGHINKPILACALMTLAQ